MKRTNVKNYVAFALCILNNYNVEQAFEVIANKPEIVETLKNIRI
ncbi:MAG: hypothetical protein AAGU27_03185 [Dehalobacterium sp.]